MINSQGWLSIEEAAAHLRMGKTVLYTLAREGRVPANRVGRKWMFEKEQLDAWARSNQPVESFFAAADFNVEGNESLREPQREAYLRTAEFFRAGRNRAILQIPVGCGKTGISSLLPLGLAQGRVLVIAPNLTIKTVLLEAMDITNRQKCFWRKAGVLTGAQMVAGPFVCTLDSGNVSVATKSHIVVSNIQQLATNVDKWLNQFPDGFFDMIIVDEAHHSAAESWKKVLERFPAAKVIHLTATPFRSDRREIDGELVYRYSFRSATLKGYIKRLKASYVAPSEIELSFSDSRGRKYSLDEVLQLKEEDWFSKGVALAPLCNQHIVDSSLERLEELRQTGTRHQLIAVACSINHARDLRSMYEERGYTADIIHSKQDYDEQQRVLASLKNGTLDCIVQVQMLGEGFDHPHLSVAAIFRPFRSLSPYVQFVGRIMRVIVQNNPTHPDNVGHIVTHLGMNLDRRLSEFKQFERDDEAFWAKLIEGADPEVPISVREGDARLSADESPIVVRGEIVEGLWEEDFAPLEDQEIVAELRERLELLGLDPSEAEELVKKSKPGGKQKRPPSSGFPVLPQRALEQARKRLYEQGARLAKIVLNHVELDIAGRELPYQYTALGISGRNNLVAAIAMVNKEINKRLGKDRSLCSLEEIDAVLGQVNDVVQTIARRVRKAKTEYENRKA
ncbi:MAG TPA: DEAD/DEAH box helicase family protein [Candidatus Baltobacteraceae bacterium]|nr:DEAD/DEAH box helicase family protein [Candidatus Baltobacteraceae bacterium]